MRDGRPILGITMGDPAGIGPEILVKALARPETYDRRLPIAIADASVIRRAAQLIDAQVQVRDLESISQARGMQGVIDVFDLKLNRELDRIVLGRVSAEAGDAAFRAVVAAIDLAKRREIDAVVTCPIHKEAINLAGHRFPGHTEIFAQYTDAPRYTMMLAEGDFRVVHVSTHVSLRQACDAVTRLRVLEVIELANDACRRLGIDRPRVAVAGLNPHASDGDLFGTEERDAIRPAVADARNRGIDVEGPFPGDTIFAKAAAGAYDVCVAMFHDQGHIPVKMAGFRYDGTKRAWSSVNGVNITLGLPIVRTSVDHGTAFDLAGKGTASEQSLLDAIEYAARLSASLTPNSAA